MKDSEDGIFAGKKYIEDEIDVNDIKIGHTYFLGNKKEDTKSEKAKYEADIDYLRYRVKYQIFPLYQEYYKDGLVKQGGIAHFKKILNEFEELKNLII